MGTLRSTCSALALVVLAACGAARPHPVNAEHVVVDTIVEAHRDDDGDRIVEADDRCPQDAEDLDGFEDDDGCPERDDDRDRIVDADDLCPREPETYNGMDDEDGCPDHCTLPLYSCPIQPQIARVYFIKDSSRVEGDTLVLLRALADTIVGNPQIPVIELHGHAGREERAPVRLARRRAERLRDELVAMGVDPARLVIHAHGATMPITAGRTPAERETNRRVEIVLDP
ncbi:OmpA family protein [Sandaracinus amylolyticus]|uniref:OmpA family protein n=1 Tax=Sandaracinus amylolyticus TaxID=927083 RepID=UPI001F1ABFDE|nr:OmpA family protein [Sandaracinus amylolyticus]UJR83082.1 Hypothetical protein I5071_51480 [Sandaracinus amylolyticus]